MEDCLVAVARAAVVACLGAEAAARTVEEIEGLVEGCWVNWEG